jgi:hypothetical protein
MERKVLIKNIAANVKGFFQKIITQIKNNFNNFKQEQGEKFKKNFVEGLNKYKADHIFKGVYDVDNINLVYETLGEKISAFADKGATYIFNYFQDLERFGEEFGKDKILAQIGATSEDDFANFKKITKKDYTVAQLKGKAKLIISTVSDANKLLKSIQDEYKSAKKDIDTTMKACKKLVNENNSRETANSQINAAMRACIAFLKDCISVLTQAVKAKVAVARKVRSNYIGLMARVVGKIGPKKVQESADVKVESATTVDEIEEAFNTLIEEEIPEEPENGEEELAPTDSETEGKGCKSCKEDVEEIEIGEATTDLEEALIAYFG